MTDEQIIALVKEYFIEEEVDDDGYCWLEYTEKIGVFLKFAKEMYNKGYSDCKINQLSSDDEVFIMKMGESLIKD